MKAEQLRKSILQLAIQGKLVKQDPNDEPASVLLERIRTEKQRLIKEGKIKKDKGDSIIFKGDDNCYYEKIGSEVKNIEDEIPFEIPDSWCWVHIEKITIPVGNKDNQILTSQILKEGDIPVVSQSKNLIDGYSNVIERRISDLPLIMFGDHTKVVKLINFPFVIGADGTKFFKPLLVNANYLYFLIDYVAKILPSRGYARHYTLLKKQYLPLPPIAEQERIVKEIERFEPLLADYDKLEQQATKLDGEIYDKLKKSILQYAIQGKLVKQDEQEEPASVLLERIRAEKKAQLGKKYVESYIYKGDDNCYYEKVGSTVKNITDEIPFDIHENWCWEKISNATLFQEGPGILAVDFRHSGVPLIRIAGMQTNKVSLNGCNYLDEIMVAERWKHFRLDKGDIVISSSASMDKIAEVFEDTVGAIPYTGLIRFKMQPCLIKEYFKFFIQSNCYIKQIDKQKSGGTIKHYGPSHLQKMYIPIPPITEQQRIVKKIIDLFEKVKDEN